MGAANSDKSEIAESFRDIRWLRNHWSRPFGPRAYYWYLTFENSIDLQNLVRDRQEAIAFPFYDLTSPTSLHLTLGRIAPEGDVTRDQLNKIADAAVRACREISTFNIGIGFLGGTPGAIGLSAFPSKPLCILRDTLGEVARSVYPDAPTRSPEFHPHVTIAYANCDGVPAGQVAAAVEKLSRKAPVDIPIAEAVIVLLERRRRSYAWQAVSRIPLTGSATS